MSEKSPQFQKLFLYLALLNKWNARINLTAGDKWKDLEPLFLEAIWASENYPKEAVSHLDIGSGAGFPAIILKILIPGMELEMVESHAKKGIFLETVIDELQIRESKIYTMRLETFLDNEPRRAWDCITWKGLKLRTNDLRKLLAHAHARTQFWMFHGRKAALQDPGIMEDAFKLFKSEKCPGRKQSFLSIYLPRVVSRETNRLF